MTAVVFIVWGVFCAALGFIGRAVFVRRTMHWHDAAYNRYYIEESDL